MPNFQVMPDPYGNYMRARDDREGREVRQREERRADDQRSVNSAMAERVASGDWDGLQAVAGKSGDPAIAQAARSMNQEEAFRAAAEFNGELQTIAAIADPNAQRQAYMGWYNRALSFAQQRGALSPEARAQFDATHPTPDAPDLSARIPQAAQHGQQLLRQRAAAREGANEWLTRDDARVEAERIRNTPDWTIDDYGTPYGQTPDGRLFRRGEDGTVQPTQNIPQRAPISNNGGAGYGPGGMPAEQIRLEREFSREWRGVYQNYSEIRNEFGRIQQMANRADSAGDLALVVSFTKMLDPGSVAREGEVALTQRAASIMAQVQNLPQQWVNGRTLLPPAVRQQLLAAAREMYSVYQGAYNNISQDYEQTAISYGFDPARVMMGYRSPAVAGDDNEDVGGGETSSRPPNVPPDYIQDAQGNWHPPEARR